MASPQSEAADAPPLPPVKLDPLAALLSYLIPGLGQVYQGRIGKGLLFFGGLYLLFFYGMWMGKWRNVWLPDASELPDVTVAGQTLGGAFKAAYYRPQFLGQFWIGAAAWPSVIQYVKYDKAKDVGPAPFGKFERAPTEEQLNELQRNSSKRWDLGWVYTVIAGVLNLLVIYDALAGPMFRDPPKSTEDAPDDSTAAAEQAAAPVAAANPAAAAPAPVPFPAALPADSPAAPVAQKPEPAANPPGGAS